MLPLMLGMDTMVVDTDTEDTTVDTMATLTDTVTTEARGLPHLKPNPKPMLMPKLPLMPGTDTTVWDTVTTDTDTMDTDTVWDTVDTTDTDIPVLTDTTDTTLARGLLMPNLKPKLIPLLMLGMDTMAVDTDTGMAEDTMADTMDTVMDMDTDTTVKKLF